jgi:hypothetical protein
VRAVIAFANYHEEHTRLRIYRKLEKHYA